jgi:acyl-CoA synthetase (AMP-forming)/AMP-acid ligase II
MSMSLFATVAQAVEQVGAMFPDSGYVFQNMRGIETSYSYLQVEQLTASRAAAMQEMGLRKGDRIGLVVIEPEDFVLTFLAAIRIGVVPVPLYPPLSFGALDAYAEKTARVLTLSGARVVFASGKLQNILWSLVDKVSTLERLVKVEDLAQSEGTPRYPEVTPEDVAFLQYTSGSTSDPKGVIVTHASLIANCHAIIVDGLQKGNGTGTAVSWLPLYHDMGLIGFVIATITNGMKSVFIPTMRFIKKPTVWMDALHEHQATVTFAPNFAYALVMKKVKPRHLEAWDLSHMEAFGCGAEPIHPDTARAFTSLFSEQCAMNPNAFLPAYGMAEATLAISFKPLQGPLRTQVVNAATFQSDGVVEPPVDGEPIFEHVSCGPVFKDHDMGAFTDDGTRLAEGVEGELRLHGPSVTAGYFENDEATRACYVDGWLRTGDLGYILDGEVYVTGRVKDLIILNGRNLHPQAIEWVAAEIDGVRKGNVVAFSRPGAASEELVVVLETRAEDHADILAGVKKAVRGEVGIAPADVICLPPGSLPKTSSGKLQRRKTRAQYLGGELGVEGTRTMGSRGSTLTVARHVARSVWSRAKSLVR